MEDADKNDPVARLALVLFRHSLLLDQGDFARAAGIAPSQLSVYERGERAAPREVVERAATAAGFPIHLLDALFLGLRSFRAASRERSRAERVLVDQISAQFAELVQVVVELMREPLARLAGREPMDAAGLWAHLEECTPAERRLLVEELEEYWRGDLCVRVAAESRRKAPSHPQEALELAELALSIAERASGTEAGRLHLQGYAWAHVAAARRAHGDQPGAEEALDRARQSWGAGGPGDMELMEEISILGRFRRPSELGEQEERLRAQVTEKK
jgi:transcriptional regulator with XRE-family HTH domain